MASVQDERPGAGPGLAAGPGPGGAPDPGSGDGSTPVVISAQGLTKRYGDFTAVDRLDLTIREGEIFGLLGPNGAGKTTTILMLLGLSEPTAGQARVHGLDPARTPLKVKRQVGYLPDNVGFYEWLSGRQNLRFTAELNGLRDAEARKRIDDLLQLVGLAGSGDHRVETYSRGMRQRLGIADLLMKRPRTIILDEPTLGIDPEGTREVLGLIRSLSRDQRMTVLLSSHLLYQVQEICDRVGIFVRGRLIAEGPVAALGERLAEGERRVIEVGAQPAEGVPAVLRDIPGVDDVERGPGFWLAHCRGDLRPAIARAFATRADGGQLVHLRLRGTGLDDIYLRYFQEEGGGRLGGHRP